LFNAVVFVLSSFKAVRIAGLSNCAGTTDFPSEAALSTSSPLRCLTGSKSPSSAGWNVADITVWNSASAGHAANLSWAFDLTAKRLTKSVTSKQIFFIILLVDSRNWLPFRS